MSAEIIFDRPDRCYRPGDIVSGHVILSSSGKASHSSVIIKVEGKAKLGVSAASVGMFEAFYSMTKPVVLVNIRKEIASKGELSESEGKHVFPFEFVLKPSPGEKMLETYHGVYVTVMYYLGVETSISSGFMSKSKIVKEVDFVVETPTGNKAVIDEEPVEFSMSSETMASKIRDCPKFLFKGTLHKTICQVNRPLTGEFTVMKCDAKIKSVELQLIRKESVDDGANQSVEGTECSRIQIANGDICRELPIPIYFVFPRLYTAPSFSHRMFTVAFDICLQVILETGMVVQETFPLTLVRN